MKLFLCAVAALAVIQSVSCRYRYAVDDSDELESPRSRSQILESSRDLKQLIKSYQVQTQLAELKRKAESICPGQGDSVVNATLESVTCLEAVDDTQETSCSLIQGHFGRCMQSAVRGLENCMPQQSREIPSLVVNMLLKITDKLCKTDGEHIFELANPCVISRNHRTESCLRRVKARAQQYMTKTPSASEVCEFLESLRPCALSHLEASCGNQKTRESFLDLYDAAMLSCKSVHTNIIEDSDAGQYEIVEVNQEISE